MRLLKPFTAILVLLAVLAPTALAAGKLDPHFGRHGGFTTALPANVNAPAHLAVAPSNKSYVQKGPWVVAFGADGQPDRGFGKNGRIKVASKAGALAVNGIAVDSLGRILVVGSVEPVPGLREHLVSGSMGSELAPEGSVTEAFVARYLPNGTPDPTFGSDGEVVTTFGAPRPQGTTASPAEYERPNVKASRIEVDAEGRPVIAAEFAERVETCLYRTEVDQAIVARLNYDGSLDTSFGASGYATIPSETPIGLAAAPAGGWATLSGPLVCEHGLDGIPTRTSVLTEAGAPLSTLDPARPNLTADEEVLAVDRSGRIYYAPRNEFEGLIPSVIRLLPDGDLDTSFGKGGAVSLEGIGATDLDALAIDAKGRVIAGFGTSRLEIARISSKGLIEKKFGEKGSLHSPLKGSIFLQALAIDSKGRIVAAGTASRGSLTTGNGIGIARFLPEG